MHSEGRVTQLLMPIKLDIRGHSNFQPIHLGGLSIEAPCKPLITLPECLIMLTPTAMKTSDIPTNYLQEINQGKDECNIHVIHSKDTSTLQHGYVFIQLLMHAADK
ncbi:hypothetical protein AVEN_22401-1 [Araneus ventricosus]|uniref:Uncharacterized protein n=1 Tax=Araneus ventricosus TaxID=182803 RepID=A0A4Y2N1H6_ARAVE|nr:hypothetical protein AVEN_22401-1 [Araneus ventricosus]